MTNESLKRPRKWVSILVEIKARSFEAKLLLACFLAEAGFGAVVGNKRMLDRRWRDLPPGVWFEKSITPYKLKRMFNRHQAGFQTVCLDEEGLIISRKVYTSLRMSAESLAAVSRFFCWGQFQADTVAQELPDHASKLVLTGNPRVDLWRPEFRVLHEDTAAELRTEFGDFVLILSNYANFIDDRDIRTLIDKQRGKNIKTAADEQWLWDLVNFQTHVRESFEVAIKALATRWPERTFIVRPHPADNQNYWTKFKQSTPANVQVIYRGFVTPWLLAAKAVLHNSCTTGLEALLVGQVPIAYVPFDASQFEIGFSNAVSRCVSDLPALEAAIDDAYTNQEWSGRAAAEATAADYITAMTGPLACERIIAELNALEIAPQAMAYSREPYSRIRYRLRDWYLQFLDWGDDNGLSKLLRTDPNRMKLSFMRAKFAGSTLQEVEQFIAKLQQKTGRFQNVRVTQIDQDMYAIYQ